MYNANVDASGKDQVLAAAEAVSGDRARAIHWFAHEKLAAFDGKTAEQLVHEGRAPDVVRYIESLEAGPAG